MPRSPRPRSGSSGCRRSVMAHAVVNMDSIEARNGIFRPMRQALGVTAFGINQIELSARAEGYEHDESSTGQEEVYVFLRGSGVLRVDGGEIEVKPGRYVLVAPGTTRQPVAGPEGLAWACAGAPRHPEW